MGRSAAIRLAAAVGALALFFAGLAWWYAQRMERGKILPEYSSLRADPRGARVLFEALDRMEGVTAFRSLGPGLPEAGPGDAVLVLGFPARRWKWALESHALDLASLASGGGRVVLAFHPRPGIAPDEDEEEEELPEGEEEEPDAGEPETDETGPKADPAAADAGTLTPAEEADAGFALVLKANLRVSGDSAATRAVLSAGDWPRGMPRHLPLHTPLRLELSPPWRPVYEAPDGVVAAERPLGRGTVVLLADSYWLSNEALAFAPRPVFWSWVLSGARRVAFEERHLGVSRDQGVMVLARKYRLEGFLAGILLTLALALWRSLSPFLPIREPPPSPEEGADAARGMESLLSRRLPGPLALDLALAELSRPGPLDRLSGEAKKRVEQAARNLAQELGPKDPEEAWKQITELVTQETGK